MIACENSGHSVVGDFPEVRKILRVRRLLNLDQLEYHGLGK